MVVNLLNKFVAPDDPINMSDLLIYIEGSKCNQSNTDPIYMSGLLICILFEILYVKQEYFTSLIRVHCDKSISGLKLLCFSGLGSLN